jgi:2-polyprenyl-3-methyl-5-hydroxy-6-metoxy-1,4-benzoquinol methylase
MPTSNHRTKKIAGLDYKKGALNYVEKLNEAGQHHLLTKPFFNVAHKQQPHPGRGLDAETRRYLQDFHREWCDFANIALLLDLRPDQRILDVGCGPGWLCEYFARLSYDVTGLDVSPSMVDAAYRRLNSVPYGADYKTPLKYRFLEHDVEAAPLPEVFDAIICYDALHHFEDESAVIRHLSEMLDYGGLLFILEGDKPPEGSDSEKELLAVMEKYGTLESPFNRDYLLMLLRENGLAIVGNYLSVNQMIERDLVEDGRMPVETPALNYLLCKKVAARGADVIMPDSLEPHVLAAQITLLEEWPSAVRPAERMKILLNLKNTGDTLWLTGPAARTGAVTLGVRVLDERDELLDEFHGHPPIYHALAPGEETTLELDYQAPSRTGSYRLKIDLVDQHKYWFEQKGSLPLMLPLNVEV